MSMSENKSQELEEKMTEALKISKKAWDNAGMPVIYDGSCQETGKIGVSLLAIKIFDQL